jgi:hypothetical protein
VPSTLIETSVSAAPAKVVNRKIAKAGTDLLIAANARPMIETLATVNAIVSNGLVPNREISFPEIGRVDIDPMAPASRMIPSSDELTPSSAFISGMRVTRAVKPMLMKKKTMMTEMCHFFNAVIGVP